MTMLLFHSLHQRDLISKLVAISHNIITRKQSLQMQDQNMIHLFGWSGGGNGGEKMQTTITEQQQNNSKK